MSDQDALPAGEVLARIASLAEVLGVHPEVGAEVVELLDWVDAFHREGLGRLVEMIRAWRGEIFLEAVAGDEVAGGLLDAYGLGEGSQAEAEEAVERAMAEVRPLVASHGGSIEVVRVGDGVVEVRLDGACDGCPSSAATLTLGVEEALRRHWVSFRRLEVGGGPTQDPAGHDLPRSEAGSGATSVTIPLPSRRPPPPARGSLLQIRGHELP